MRNELWMAAALGALSASPTLAGQGADLTRQHLYAGTLSAGIEELAPLAAAGDAEAQFCMGFMQFTAAAQDFVGTLLGYGLITPNPAFFKPLSMGRSGVSPEALSYEALRATLEAFVDRLDSARLTLVAAADAGGDWVVEVDLARIRLDFNGDGKSSEAESLAAIGEALEGDLMAGPIPLSVPNVVPPPDTRLPPRGAVGAALGPPAVGIGFDRADGYWLGGYTEVLAAQVDFLLAHDFSATFTAIGHRLFDSPVFPLSGRPEAGNLFMDPATDGQIADLIAAIHTISWPVIDSPRLARVVDRLHGITALSRKNWDAILAESDDRLEVVPSPRQTALNPDARVTDEMVAAWRETLDTVDRIVDGQLTLPHWRFTQGVDLKAFLTEATRTDMVMLLTGVDMIPFLRDGPKADADDFRGANRVFGNDLWSYVFWFN